MPRAPSPEAGPLPCGGVLKSWAQGASLLTRALPPPGVRARPRGRGGVGGSVWVRVDPPRWD